MKYFNILFVVFAVLLVFASADEESNPCLQPMRQGRCRGSIPKFYYDSATSECKSFKYGGCGGNDNNFNTIEECEEKCKNQAN